MTKKVIYETQWRAKDITKEYPHGYGFMFPLVEFPQDKDVVECMNECKKLSNDEFECYTAIPRELLSLPRDRDEYDKNISTKHNSVCLSRAGDDEPIFVLRAKDITAPEIVIDWCSKNITLQPQEKLEGAMNLAQQMKMWHDKNIANHSDKP